MINRRKFLELSAVTSLSLCVQTPEARANQDRYDGPYVAVFNARGGWDTTYLMDPRGTPDLNDLYREGEIREAGGIRYAPTEGRIQPDRMTNRTFFERYGAELLVVNGIDVSVNNHSPCSRYVATGELDSLVYPTFPALVAAAKCPDVPLAFLSFGEYSATGNLVPLTRVPYLPNLERLANGEYTSAARTRRYHHETVSARIEATLGAVNAETHSLSRVARARRFVHEAQMASKSLSRIVPHIPERAPDDHFLVQVEIALAAFASGLGVSANLQMGTFDSHNTNDVDQMNLIPQFLAGIDYMMVRAEEIGLRNRLIVIIQSEMGRTPWYNGTRGKDHWSVNSMMAMGPGITGNRVVGGTHINPDSGFDLSPNLIDPVTLAESPDGIRMRPEHIQTAQRALLGIADHPFSAKFDLGVPEAERLTTLFPGG